MALHGAHVVGIAIVFFLITVVGIYAGRNVSSAEDFATCSRKAGSFVVAGTLLGTMIGGAATLGTAQLAFRYGVSAWWFCLGAGIGFTFLGLGLGRRLYKTSSETIPQILVRTYGSRIGPIATVFSSLGILISLIANAIAFIALCTSVLRMTPLPAAWLGAAMILIYVMFGGMWGAGLNGVLKIVLVYAALLCCGIVAYIKVGGISGLAATFPLRPWFSLFGRGFGVDCAAGLSMLLGIVSTQTYYQAIASGKDFAAARRGALISAIVAPPIGVGGILVGLYMRSAFPQTPSGEVLPLFALKFLPPVVAGIVLGTLLIAVVGCSAGLALGISTMFTEDIYKRYFRPRASEKEGLMAQRAALLLISIVTALFASGNSGSIILEWNFLSMGLRGCAVIVPLLGAIFFPHRVTPMAGAAAALLGPLTVFIWRFIFPGGIDPLYPGLVMSMAALILVGIFTKKPAHKSYAAGA